MIIRFCILSALILLSFPSAGSAQNDKGSISLGFAQNAGNTNTSSFNGKLKLSREMDKYRIFFNAKNNTSATDGKTTKEETDVDLRGELRIGRFFPFWDVRFYRNPFRKFASRIATGPGLGYYFIKTENVYLTGGYYVHYDIDNLTEQSDRKTKYFMQHLEIRNRFYFTDSLKFKQKAIYKLSTRTSADYYVYYTVTLEDSITKTLSLEVRYFANYQNEPVSADVRRVDSTFTTGIKFKF